MLDYSVVEAVADDPSAPTPEEWQRVRTAGGRTGYVSARYLRSPIDHRALFEFRAGRWWLVAYVAGD
jgi:hypothetical protein